ncbi:MAG: T9SS type A sorting domain-containing protein [Fluviicola sp.]|nr:T9SS type A sorting domain-containing protein [Fluviicola sp.]
MKALHLITFLVFTPVVMAQSQGWKQLVYANKTATFQELCTQIETYFKESADSTERINASEKEEEGSEYNKYQQWKYFMQFRLTEDGYLPSPEVVLEAFANEKAKQKVAKSALCDWTFIDQVDNDGGYWGIGRTTCVTFHPANDQLFYVCSPGGGIWKTTDGGQTYASADDGLPYGAASNLLIDPSNPNTLYVSNGDNSGWWTSSTGVYKSTDAGATWLPTDLVFTLDATAIYELKMSPTNPSVIVAATTNGLFRTVDGGVNWTTIRAGSYSSVSFKPDDGNVIYAALDDYWGVSQVFKSTDAGATWAAITAFTWNYNFITLATTPLDVDRLLVSCDYGGLRPLFQSLDGGATYNQLADTPENTMIGYSPNDVNTLYCGYVVAYRSTNGGSSWTQITDWWGSGQFTEIHADFHYIAYSNNSSHVYFCNDGGVYKLNETTDQWTDLSNGLKIGQFYRIANAGNHALVMIGGTQDNGGRKRLPNGSWINANGGDGMEVAMRPDNIQEYYTCYINGTGLERTLNGGSTTTNISDNLPGDQVGQWVTPYEIDPTNSDELVAGYNRIFRSPNKGNTWFEIGTNTVNPSEGVVDIEISATDQDVIFASYSDQLLKTMDGGGSWTTYNLPGNAPITRIALDPANHDHIYVSRGGYTNNTKVYKSTNGGTTWVNYSTGLPNVPCNVIITEPNSPGRLYVGNDYGVYYRDSVMTSWEPYGENLPITFVNDLKIAPAANKLRAGTFGRGIWEVDLCATSVAGVSEVGITDTYALIYPNPVKNTFSIVQKTVHPIEQIQLVDLNGKKVAFQTETKSGMVVVTVDLPAGFYLLTYTANGETFSSKIAVE